MYLNLKINPGDIKETQVYTTSIGYPKPFNILTIGKDSYIVDAQIETGLNMDRCIMTNPYIVPN